MYFYYDTSGNISMYSSEEIEAPQFRHIFIELSDEEMGKLKENWKPHIRNKKLILEMPDWKKSEIEQQEREQAIENIKAKIKKQKDEDTKTLLNDILNLLKK